MAVRRHGAALEDLLEKLTVRHRDRYTPPGVREDRRGPCSRGQEQRTGRARLAKGGWISGKELTRCDGFLETLILIWFRCLLFGNSLYGSQIEPKHSSKERRWPGLSASRRAIWPLLGPQSCWDSAWSSLLRGRRSVPEKVLPACHSARDPLTVFAVCESSSLPAEMGCPPSGVEAPEW